MVVVVVVVEIGCFGVVGDWDVVVVVVVDGSGVGGLVVWACGGGVEVVDDASVVTCGFDWVVASDVVGCLACCVALVDCCWVGCDDDLAVVDWFGWFLFCVGFAVVGGVFGVATCPTFLNVLNCDTDERFNNVGFVADLVLVLLIDFNVVFGFDWRSISWIEMEI